MEQEIIRPTELLTMEPTLKQGLRKKVKDRKFKKVVAKELGVSRVTLNSLLKGKGNAISIQKVRDYLAA